MKRIIITMFCCLILTGCVFSNSNEKDKENNFNNQDQVIENNKGDDNVNLDNIEVKKLYIKVNNQTLIATLENNSSVNALIQKLMQNDITIDMHDYANFEKVGELGFSLPRNDEQITTTAGDIILYQGNSITIYYDTNSWNFTRLAHIDNINQKELKEILGNGNVIVTFSLKN